MVNIAGGMGLLPWLIASVTLTAVGVEGMRRWGMHRLLDLPNARSSHTRPTPRGGGMALLVVALGLWVAATPVIRHWSPALALLLATLFVVAVSWVDDLRGLPFRVRLLAHVGAAVFVLWMTPPPDVAPLAEVGAVPLGLLRWPLAVIWIAGLTNAYNFMDGIDGIAGVQGVVAGSLWVAIALTIGSPIAVLAALLVVGTLTFLGFNWSPAKIFMGDVGSAPLGFLFAAIPFQLEEAGGMASLWVVGAAAVWPFVFDSGFTLVRRWRRGERITEAHRSHLYQRLVIAGWSHARTSLFYFAWAATTATAALAMWVGAPWAGTWGLSWAALSGILVWRLTLRVERAAAA